MAENKKTQHVYYRGEALLVHPEVMEVLSLKVGQRIDAAMFSAILLGNLRVIERELEASA